jgi:hypothetical protein
VAKNLHSRQANKNFLLKRDSPTNLLVAEIAVTQERTTNHPDAEKCILLLALHAASQLRFHFSPKKTDLYIAVNVSQNKDSNLNMI